MHQDHVDDSISMEYCCLSSVLVRLLTKAALVLSLMVKWLLFPCYDWWPTSSSAAVAASSEGIKGAEARARHRAAAQAVREGLRVSTYGELVAEQEEAAAATCAVCLSEVGRRERVWELRNCRHVFHRGCLDRWLDHDEHLSCPLCREPLLARRSTAGASPLHPPPPPPPPSEPSWAVERLLYFFGDDLLLHAPAPLPS
ncbi:RING-H2 finger protein ATL74-like [Musa acuminata AAA Group]|uniref:RING-H2 finger protein ATL74-like n=1 Tax=Musa acuminata AAA Group TaxID=214697 RepID=UPI0031D73E30